VAPLSPSLTSPNIDLARTDMPINVRRVTQHEQGNGVKHPPESIQTLKDKHSFGKTNHFISKRKRLSSGIIANLRSAFTVIFPRNL